MERFKLPSSDLQGRASSAKLQVRKPPIFRRFKSFARPGMKPKAGGGYYPERCVACVSMFSGHISSTRLHCFQEALPGITTTLAQ